jgi:hypothetical protein
LAFIQYLAISGELLIVRIRTDVHIDCNWNSLVIQIYSKFEYLFILLKEIHEIKYEHNINLKFKVLVPKLFKNKSLAIACIVRSVAAGQTTELMIYTA